ncbi:MAG: 30S ribosomal protein S8 [Nitrospirae bacterium]|nr:30S ribosomal protein S8 [Nitrospirota bacterium]
MTTDPIADLLIRLQNGAQRRHETVTVPASKLKTDLLRILKAEGFISNYEPVTADGHPALRVQLRYVGEGQSIITGMRRISKPGKRVYVGKRDVKPVMGGMGLAILSTSKGLMTDQESRRASLGGEVVCHVW